jgi:8-oxo-dGTP diphosphatase
MIRRFGAPPEAGRDYVRRIGAYALLPRGGRLLVTCQHDPDPDFQLPGGGVDPGESPLLALHREVLEETGWRISGVRRIGAFRRFVFMPEYGIWAEKICLIFRALPTLRLGPPSEAQHSAHWMTPGEAARLLSNAGDRYVAARHSHLWGHGPMYSKRVAETSSSMP